ncbi:hypothetical protein FRC12_005825 [Ceratobasidium sp. 428]|nr:hypothetical protein FRC12_005825 [Ceratobasidium sp. 428]
MTAASLDTLPPDVLLAIFLASSPASIRACRRVCRSLRSFISTNDYLQYLLALENCEYVKPLCPRMDLSYAQKKQMLDDHWDRWYDHPWSSYRVVTYHELPMGKGRVEASANGMTSNNRGTGFNQWSFRTEIQHEVSVAVDPDQDLLAILDRHFTIHLLTATTKEHHPKSPTLPIALKRFNEFMIVTTWGDGIELFGHLLIGVFAVDRQATLSLLVIWNWTTGQEVTRLVVKTSDHTRRYQTRIFDFLSDDTLVICRRFDPTETLAQNLPEDTFGLLDIYKLNPLATGSPIIHVASLALPAGTVKDEKVTGVHFSSSLYTPPSLRPQVWEISPKERLICVSTHGTYHGENVCLHAQTLLEYASSTNNSIVRWDEWGLQAAWDKWDGPVSRSSSIIKTHGQRLIAAKSLWMGEKIEVSFIELERTQDDRIVPICRRTLVLGPDLSKQNGGEALSTGPLTQISINNESSALPRLALLDYFSSYLML